jgi:oligopeptidase B
VPFVDVLTTMLDETIPLTVVEVGSHPGARGRPCPAHRRSGLPCAQWEEWGNPNLEDFYFYMKSYSPIDQVSFRHGPYPPVLIKGMLLFPPRIAPPLLFCSLLLLKA